MLTVRVNNLVVEAKHGVHPKEKETAQRFVFNVEAVLNSDKSAVSDELADTLNYSEIRQLIIDTARNNSFDLIERLARAVAEQILLDKRVGQVTVSIDKPDVYDNGAPGVTLVVKSGVGD